MDVAAWLNNLGLGQYEAAFRDNAIDADLLPSLTAEDLKDLGVAIVGHRRKLLDAIAALARGIRAGTPSRRRGPAADFARAALSSRPQPNRAAAELRPVTVMFCDLVGSTRARGQAPRGGLARPRRRLSRRRLRAAVTGFGGHVLKRLGDGLMALLGYPQRRRTTPNGP